MNRVGRKRTGALAVSVLAALWLSCLGGSASGVWHVVQPGENLYRIARYYGVDARELQHLNDIDDVANLRVGREIWIPGDPAMRSPSGPLVPPPEVQREMNRRRAGGRAVRAGGALSWPARGTLTSRYGPRWGRMHQGLDIGARPGTPIYSAGAGRVIYSGRLGSYGNVVIVRHEELATVYAHNRKNRVRKGDRVRQGDLIAEVGASGNATGPHLHFEVRKNDRPLDPLRYLP